ncbi:hypothetical protein I6I97_12485 [Sphingobacterium multivorum]|uniref:hypothetical protein n=1 Tax=Sphingobacterium multivorum TaxID=28454 RepID=UPI00191A86DE|nr:hypothetical protein [Sphingobacterium multivorum]QQT60083.1 hypothetical protein I6I97_12485 [Sphingobacterium multivorum]
MKKILLFLVLIGFSANLIGQENSKYQVFVTPNGITFNNQEKYLVIENDRSKSDQIKLIQKNLNSKHLSKHLKFDVTDDAITLTDYKPGFTKSDKTAGSAYLLDLTYKISIDVKDNMFRINAPLINISANQKYESDAVIFNKGVQFPVTMEIKGKRDVWNSKEKKMFIYDEKGKLIEKSTKEKLEKDLSDLIKIIADQSGSANW